MAKETSKVMEDMIRYSEEQESVCRQADNINISLYSEYGVKRGLRDVNGKGVLAGLTNVSKIISSKMVDGKEEPCDGRRALVQRLQCQ